MSNDRVSAASPASAHKLVARLCFIFFVSGFSALLYQVVWQRLLTVYYGVGAISITLIVSVYMAGLGLGALLGGALAERVKNRIGLYFSIELLIGLFGIVSLPFLDYLGKSTAGASYLLTFGCMFLFLFFPTVLMGMTLPLLTKILNRLIRDFFDTVSTLYFINTLGAAAGALAGSYLLISFFGLDTTLHVAVALNLLLAGLILTMRRGLPQEDLTAPSAPIVSMAGASLPRLSIPLLVLVTRLPGDRLRDRLVPGHRGVRQGFPLCLLHGPCDLPAGAGVGQLGNEPPREAAPGPRQGEDLLRDPVPDRGLRDAVLRRVLLPDGLHAIAGVRVRLVRRRAASVAAVQFQRRGEGDAGWPLRHFRHPHLARALRAGADPADGRELSADLGARPAKRGPGGQDGRHGLFLQHRGQRAGRHRHRLSAAAGHRHRMDRAAVLCGRLPVRTACDEPAVVRWSDAVAAGSPRLRWCWSSPWRSSRARVSSMP